MGPKGLGHLVEIPTLLYLKAQLFLLKKTFAEILSKMIKMQKRNSELRIEELLPSLNPPFRSIILLHSQIQFQKLILDKIKRMRL